MLSVGTNDGWLLVARHTKSVLESNGFTVKLREILNHGHGYYRISRNINREAWNFLKGHSLGFPPYFQVYDFLEEQ